MNDRPQAIGGAHQRCVELLAELRQIPDPPETSEHIAALRAISDRALSIDDPVSCSELSELLFQLGICLHYGGEADAALRVGYRYVTSARAVGDPHVLRRALSLLGNFQIQMDDLAGAAGSLLEALQVAASLNDPGEAAPVWNNLGLLFQQLGQYGSATQCFESSLQAYASRATSSNALTSVALIAWANIANCAMHLCEWKAGVAAAERSLALDLNTGNNSSDQFCLVFAEHQLVRLHLEAGNLAAAEDCAQHAHKFAGKAGTTIGAIYADMTTGLLDVYAGRTDAGLGQLIRCTDFTRRRQAGTYPEALSALIEALEVAGQPDAALVYLHEMLSTKREAQTQRLAAVIARLGGSAVLREPDTAFERLVSVSAIDLELQVHASVSDLINSAITGSEQAGHDQFHIFRVSKLVELFAASLGWERERARDLGFASRLMDIGMLVIPPVILQKTRALSDGERKILYEHTQFGAEILPPNPA